MNQKAFTLVEMLISMVIFLIIMTGVYTLYYASFKTAEVARNVQGMNDSLRNSTDVIKNDLSKTLYNVYQGISIPNVGADISTISGQNDLTSYQYVYDAYGATIGKIPQHTDTVSLPIGADEYTIHLDLGSCDSGEAGPDPMTVTSTMLQTDEVIRVSGGGECDCYFDYVQANYSAAPLYCFIVGHTEKGLLSAQCELFELTGVSSSGSVYQLQHASSSFNTSNNLHHRYQQGAKVYMLGTHPSAGLIEYFVMEDTSHANPNDPSTPLKNLVKRINNRDVLIVAENVTNVQFRYYDNTGSPYDNPALIYSIGGRYIIGVEVEITNRSAERTRTDSTSALPPDPDPVTGTDRARYIERTYSTYVAVRPAMFNDNNQVSELFN